MKLFVKAHAKSRREKLVKLDDNHFEIWVREVPEDGKANQAILKTLSEYFVKPRGNFVLTSGHTAKNKTIEFEGVL